MLQLPPAGLIASLSNVADQFRYAQDVAEPIAFAVTGLVCAMALILMVSVSLALFLQAKYVSQAH